MARPERFELPTFWFVGGNRVTRGTTPAYKSLKNQQKTHPAFGWFRMALYPVHGQLHGQNGMLYNDSSPDCSQLLRRAFSSRFKFQRWSPMFLSVGVR